jgi:hypothetical protein
MKNLRYPIWRNFDHPEGTSFFAPKTYRYLQDCPHCIFGTVEHGVCGDCGRKVYPKTQNAPKPSPAEPESEWFESPPLKNHPDLKPYYDPWSSDAILQRIPTVFTYVEPKTYVKLSSGEIGLIVKKDSVSITVRVDFTDGFCVYQVLPITNEIKCPTSLSNPT